MKKLQMVGSMMLAAALVAVIPQVQAAENAPSGHNHGTTTRVELGTLTVAGFDFGIVSSGPITAGSEPHFDISFPADKTFPRAVRMWIGTENAIQTGKTRLAYEAGHAIHTHIPAPSPLAADHKIWIEVDTATGKVRGSLPIASAGASAHAHGDDDLGLKALVTAGADGVYTLALTSEGAPVNAPSVPVYLIDSSLTDFQSVTAKSDAAGSWTFGFQPKGTGSYRALAVAPHGEGIAIATAAVPVAGAETPVVPSLNTTATVDGYTFTLAWASAPVKSGADSDLTVTVADAAGKPAAIGSNTTVIAISADREAVSLAELERTRTAGLIKAEVEFEDAGFNKLFVVTTVGGKEVVAAFGVEVAAGAEHKEDGHDHKH